MKHYQIHITILSITLIMGALVISDFAIAQWLEAAIIQSQDSSVLKDIIGSRECACESENCSHEATQEKCTWGWVVVEGENVEEGESPGPGLDICTGCIGLARIIYPYGEKLECVNKDGLTSCCSSWCEEHDPPCPTECPVVALLNTGLCIAEYMTPCNSTSCYSPE